MTRTNRELKLIFAVIVVLFAVFLAGPILILLGKSLWDGGLTGEFYASVLSQKGFLPALGNSFAVAGASAAAATLLAFLLALPANELVLPLLLAVGSAFIWEFQVTGNDTVPTEEILQALERCGVGVGSRGIGLDQDDLRNRALPLLPDVVYLAVNVRGCTAHVQVVERTRPPHLYRDSDVQNVIAEKDGLITRIEALDGVTCTAVGEVVQAGQVLLSGVADSPRGYRCLRATGRVWARTWYEWTVPIPLRTEVKTEEADSCTRLWLDMGRQRIKLCGGGSVLEGNCDKITEYRRLRLPFGVQTPVTLAVERTVRHTAYAGERPEAEARAEGERQLLAQLEQTIGEDGRILRRETLGRRQGAYLLVTLRAECEEQIGADAPLRIITSDTGR